MLHETDLFCFFPFSREITTISSLSKVNVLCSFHASLFANFELESCVDSVLLWWKLSLAYWRPYRFLRG